MKLNKTSIYMIFIISIFILSLTAVTADEDRDTSLNNDITFESDEGYEITEDTSIEGNNHKISLNSRNITLYNVSESLTISNLEICDGINSNPVIHINPSAKVVLNNVTFRNFQNSTIIYNEGSLTVTNSTVINCINPLIIIPVNATSMINGSLFNNNRDLLLTQAVF